MSHTVAVVYLGEIVEIGPRAAVFGNPQHEYTKKLMAAVPIPAPDHRHERKLGVSEELKSPIRPVAFEVRPPEYRQVSKDAG